MPKELAAYLRLQATVAAAFNFFISGMIAALIYHKAEVVPTDTVSIAIDLTLSCLLTFVVTAPFCRASLRRDRTAGVLPAKTRTDRLLAFAFHRPVLTSLLPGFCAALLLFIPAAAIFALLSVTALPFYVYIAIKSVFAALLGALATCSILYAGMLKTG